MKILAVIFVFFSLTTSFIDAQNKPVNNLDDDSYIAGVVEYGGDYDIKEKSPLTYLQNNVKAYLYFIDLAKEKNVDILVFPEATLNYFSTRSTLLEYAFLIPDPSENIAPWERTEYSELIRDISRRCKDKQIYVLINLVEKVPCSAPSACKNPKKTYHDGYDLFNTNVVFDRQGRVISKYQKFNLFLEPLVDNPITAQHSTFLSDFGVKFGHFICFDILFQEPAMRLIETENITNILYPSMWYSELPFLTSNQIHQGWAYGNNINLISAGASNPIDGNTGSGIYSGKHGTSVVLISPYPTQKLLIAKLPKDPKSNFVLKPIKNVEKITFTPKEMQNLRMTEFWSRQKVEVYNISNEPQTICVNGDDFCCSYSIQFKKLNVPTDKIFYEYKLVVNYTTNIFGLDRKCGEMYCSIISCKNLDPKSCGKRFKNNTNLFNAYEFDKISIKARIKYDNPIDLLVLPNSLDTSILPLDTNKYTFNSNSDIVQKKPSYREVEMKSESKIKDILTFGIYGRNFALDEFLPSKI